MFFAGEAIITLVDGNLINYCVEFMGEEPQPLALPNGNSYLFSSVMTDTNKTISVSTIV
jgi:hypothetical protein